jgi:hypothetical protein
MAKAHEHTYETTVTTSTPETYCTCGSELERKVGPVELLELLAAHHLAAAYCGMKGSDIDLNFVSRSGTGSECHRMDGPAYGFTYTNESGGEGTFVRLGEESHTERISTVVHEVRHRWQFDAAHGLSFATEDAAEADAYAFMDEYAPKIGAQVSELADEAAEWVKTARDKGTLLDKYQRALDALAPEHVHESELPVVESERLGPGGGYYQGMVDVGGRSLHVFRIC